MSILNVVLQKYNTGPKYKLSDSDIKRHSVLSSYVNLKSKKDKKSKKVIAIEKKRRLNVLRIYKKNSNKKHCKIITSDMIWLTKKYIPGGKVSSIC